MKYLCSAGLHFRLFISLVLAFLLLNTFSQERIDVPKITRQAWQMYREAEKYYNEADKLAQSGEIDEEKEKLLNEKALDGFKAALPLLQKIRNDSLAFYAWLKIGVIEHSTGNINAANDAYNNSISFQDKKTSLHDSVFFKPILYSGIIYYHKNLFDSSLIRYKQAEAVAIRYDYKLNEVERLMNNLGVLYYEMGNYLQAKNYFGKAIEVLSRNNIYYKELLVNYKINLAQAFVKLEDYDAANTAYQSLVPYHVHENEINHNVGVINLTLGAAEKAIEYFRKVHFSDWNQIRLYNDYGNAFNSLRKYDSSGLFLEKAINENEKWNGHRKNTAHGLTMKYKGDLALANTNYTEAIHFYHQAITQFYNDFNDPDFHSNPQIFSGIFSYINLFNTLIAKADVLQLQYGKEKKQEYLEASLNSFQSAFKLVEYVQKTYESDEARLFLNKIKYEVHNKPISVCLQLYELTREKKYLEEAYRFDQVNKASVLSFALHESSLQKKAGIPGKLLQKLTAIRSSITRLSLKATKLTDSLQLKKINEQIRDEEIQLARVQEQVNSHPGYASLETNKIPTVINIQKKLLDSRTAIISYHTSGKELLMLFITKNKFNYIRQAVDISFYNKIDSFVKMLHSQMAGEKYPGKEISLSLFNLLVKPLLPELKNINRLVIIPDDELNYLPFEALQDAEGRYLLQNFAIQYQYSTALFNFEEQRTKRLKEISGFAPFIDNNSVEFFPALPYSKNEVSSLDGKIFLGEEASKKNFIAAANHYGIMHLATHAAANDQEPLQSYIAFYPSKDDSGETFKLYAQEIYDLNLDSTELVILSACETGTGQLVKGEGLMSLSRAFAYAGCPNIITSLWKAEDKTTAFITTKLHSYLKNGDSKDIALQKAKLDLLNSNTIPANLKTPNYWAHLVFIGDYQAHPITHYWWWIAVAIIVVSVFVFILKKTRIKTNYTN